MAEDDVENFDFASWSTHWQVGLEEVPGTDKEQAYAEVTEELVPVFPEHDQNRGLIRSVPLDIGEGRMRVSDIKVHDANGEEVPSDTDVSGREFTVEIGDDEYVHGEQTYVITYTLHGVIADLGNPDVQEFYANLLPTTRSQPIEAFAAQVTFAPELADAIVGPESCYIGVAGSEAECDLQVDGPEYFFSGDNLGADETVTINVGFEPDTVQEPTYVERVGIWPILLSVFPPLGVILCVVLLLLQIPRLKHAKGGVVVAQYAPREDLSPMIASQVMPSLSLQAFPASILSAAVKGGIRIEETAPDPDQDQKQLKKDAVRSPQLRRTEGENQLAPIERRFVDEVLFTGTEDEVAELDGNAEIGEAFTEFSKDTKDAAAEAGFINNSQAAKKAQTRTILTAVVVFVVTVAVMVFAIVANGGWLIGVLAGMLGLTAIVAIVSAFLPTKLRTAEGAEAHDYLQGLRQYMKLSETDRIRALQGAETAERQTGEHGHASEMRIIEVYEQLLPYAVLFGLDKSWSKELQAHYESADYSPTWLYGYQPIYFAAAMNQVKSTSHTTMPNSEGGASASGFAGGGMAGGGVGGGSVGGR